MSVIQHFTLPVAKQPDCGMGSVVMQMRVGFLQTSDKSRVNLPGIKVQSSALRS